MSYVHDVGCGDVVERAVGFDHGEGSVSIDAFDFDYSLAFVGDQADGASYRRADLVVRRKERVAARFYVDEVSVEASQYRG